MNTDFFGELLFGVVRVKYWSQITQIFADWFFGKSYFADGRLRGGNLGIFDSRYTATVVVSFRRVTTYYLIIREAEGVTRLEVCSEG